MPSPLNASFPNSTRRPLKDLHNLDVWTHIVNDCTLEDYSGFSTLKEDTIKKSALRELATFLSLMLFGLLLMPLAIYWVGKLVFGEYGGTGFSAFYGTLHRAIRSADLVVLFLVFSPYLIWQLTRLTNWGFRRSLRNLQSTDS